MKTKKQKTKANGSVRIFAKPRFTKFIIISIAAILVLLFSGIAYTFIQGERLKAQAENWTYIGNANSGGGWWQFYACRIPSPHYNHSYVRVMVMKSGWLPTRVYFGVGSPGSGSNNVANWLRSEWYRGWGFWYITDQVHAYNGNDIRAQGGTDGIGWTSMGRAVWTLSGC